MPPSPAVVRLLLWREAALQWHRRRGGAIFLHVIVGHDVVMAEDASTVNPLNGNFSPPRPFTVAIFFVVDAPGATDPAHRNRIGDDQGPGFFADAYGASQRCSPCA